MSDSDLQHTARQAAQAIHEAFLGYQESFHTITQRSRERFEACDWHGMQADALERLQLYKKVIDSIVAEVRLSLSQHAKDRWLWSQMKSHYSQHISCCGDYELAETFFNSVTRRIFFTVGVDQNIEFVDSDFTPRPLPEGTRIHDAYSLDCGQPLDRAAGLPAIQQLIQAILKDHPYRVGYQDIESDSQLAAERILEVLQEKYNSPRLSHVDVLKAEFYRDNGAYIIGRMVSHSPTADRPHYIPLVVCLRNRGQGAFVDALLLDEDEISIVFSFTRSYFHVDARWTQATVDFLKSIMPLKRIAELYISIGYNKHGKTELYRDLLRHLATTQDKFEIARGERGMVMAVFTLSTYDMVFKIIKDRIEPPKSTSRQEVMERYDLVFKHDRAGRLVDAQEFEHLRFDRSRFAPDLLEHLLVLAPNTVTVTAETVSIKHLYTERRLTPLNLYVKEAVEEAARQAVIDYGQAIKDLAATNIFPGDVLLKNFGVTRHGRVVFYDYDELCLVADCKFRRMPQASSLDDEFSADPWFYVGPLDIFPAEFDTFLGLQEPLRSVFIEQHADLFGVPFWKNIQARHKAGEIFDIDPYPNYRKLVRKPS